MRNRKFGVELEFGTEDGIGPSGVRQLLRGNGIYWPENSCGYDGSEVELRTPILQGAAGFKTLKKVVDLLNAEGCYVDYDDGLHVHHDAPEFIGNKELQLKLLKSWKYNEHHIADFIEDSRADYALHDPEESPCGTFSLESVHHFEKTFNNDYPAYYRHNLNLLALREHGSVELRFHEGTLDWDEIESWIRFGQSFLNGVLKRKKPIMPVDTPVMLLNRLKTNERAKSVLIRKANNRVYANR